MESIALHCTAPRSIQLNSPIDHMHCKALACPRWNLCLLHLRDRCARDWYSPVKREICALTGSGWEDGWVGGGGVALWSIEWWV